MVSIQHLEIYKGRDLHITTYRLYKGHTSIQDRWVVSFHFTSPVVSSSFTRKKDSTIMA